MFSSKTIHTTKIAKLKYFAYKNDLFKQSLFDKKEKDGNLWDITITTIWAILLSEKTLDRNIMFLVWVYRYNTVIMGGSMDPYATLCLFLTRILQAYNNNNNNYNKRNCKIVDFAVPADHRIKLKECEKKDKYLDFASERKKYGTWRWKLYQLRLVLLVQ